MYQPENSHTPVQRIAESQPVVETTDTARVVVQQGNHFQRNLTICSFVTGAMSIAFLVFACSRYYTPPAEGFADELGALTGHAFWIALGLIVLGRRTLRNKKRLAVSCFILIVSAIAVYKSATLLRDASDAKTVVQALSSISKDALAGGQIPHERINGTPYGKMTGLVELIADWTRDVQRDADRMNGELDKCNLASIFNQEMLTQADVLSRCRVDYEKAETILSQYENQVKQRFDEFKARVKNSNLDLAQKERTLAGWNKTKARNLNGALDIIGIRKAFVHEGTRYLSFIQERHPKYAYQGKKVVLQSKDDRDTLNLFLANLARLSAQETSCVERVQREAAIIAKELEQLTGGEAPR